MRYALQDFSPHLLMTLRAGVVFFVELTVIVLVAIVAVVHVAQVVRSAGL